MKMPTIVGIFIFFSRENFMLSWDEHEKCFITSGPGVFISPMIYTNCNGPDWPLYPCWQIKSFTIYPQMNSKCPKIPCSKSEEVIYIHILLHFSPWSEYTWQCLLDKEYQNNFKIYKLNLVMLNKLICHAHFQFPANQITWSWFLTEIHIFNNTADPHVGFFRSQVIWIYLLR